MEKTKFLIHEKAGLTLGLLPVSEVGLVLLPEY